MPSTRSSDAKKAPAGRIQATDAPRGSKGPMKGPKKARKAKTGTKDAAGSARKVLPTTTTTAVDDGTPSSSRAIDVVNTIATASTTPTTPTTATAATATAATSSTLATLAAASHAGEDAIFCKLIRDKLLAHLNPWKLHDLQCVLEMRCYGGLLSDVDLKEVYFQRLWGFQEEDFVLQEWLYMSVEEMRHVIMEAMPFFRAHTNVKGYHVFPLGTSPLSMQTKAELYRDFGALSYVPVKLYTKALGSIAVLKRAKNPAEVKLMGRDWRGAYADLKWACGMNVDHGVIRKLAGLSTVADFVSAMNESARCSHIDVMEILVKEFNGRVDVGTLSRAAEGGHNDVIDYIVEKYGVDPNGLNKEGWTSLQWATMCNKPHTIRHLVEKYDVDLYYVKFGRNCLQDASRRGFTECANLLRRYMEERPVPLDREGRPIIREEV